MLCITVYKTICIKEQCCISCPPYLFLQSLVNKPKKMAKEPEADVGEETTEVNTAEEGANPF